MLCVPAVIAEPLPDIRHIFIDVANDYGVKFDLDGPVYGGPNNTYYIKADGGGLNELHISNDTGEAYGQVSTTSDQSGVFYVTNTGGRGFDDTIVILLAVNGTIPDDFSVHIRTSGYNWTPSSVKNEVPTEYSYVEGAVDETFTKDDFIYGPQTWKPGPGTIGVPSLPLYSGQDISDETNPFQLMFIDLKVGNMYPSKFSGVTLENNGASKVEYSFNNLTTFATFNGYGWCLAANQGQGISWTNRMDDPGASGFSVVGVPYVSPAGPVLDDKAWPKFQYDMRNTGQSPYAGPQTNSTKWTFATGAAFDGSGATIGSDGTIYVGSNDGSVYTLNPDGTQLWSYATGAPITGSPTVGSDGTIYIGNAVGGNTLFALNPEGTLKWQYGVAGYVTGSPAIGSDGTVYIGSGDYSGNFYAINPDGTLKWQYATGGYIYKSTPAIGTDDTIYVGSRNKNLYAFNPDGTLKWSYATGGIIYGSPVIGSDGTIYTGCKGSDLYALNPDGTLKWTYAMGGNSQYYSSSIAVGSDGTIYVGNYADNTLHAVNPDGTQKWTYITGNSIRGSSPAIGSDETVYIGSTDKNLYALNPDGTLKWQYTTGDCISSTLSTGTPSIGPDGTLYFGGGDGVLYAFNDYAAPVAGFTAVPVSGDAPLEVQFTDTSTGDPTSWAWDFDNDGIVDSTDQNPSYEYSAVGTYTVKLTATNGNGSDSETKAGYITVGEDVPKIPVAEYHFDEVSGTQANDTSGNNNHGTITGASHIPGFIGNGLLFNGFSDYIDIPTPYFPENTFTIQAWVKTSASNSQVMFSGSSTGNDKYHPIVGIGCGVSQRASGCVNRDGSYLTGTSNVTDGNWHHITFVANDNGTTSTQMRIYVDGVRENEILDPVPIGTWPNAHYIGKRVDGYYFNGIIDEVLIYDTALGDSEVLDSYLSQKANATPVAYDQSVATEKNSAKDITLTGADINGRSLTFAVVTGPSHGTLGTVSTSGVVTYTPTPEYSGFDSFTFIANNGDKDSTPATVSIMVNVAPVADFTVSTTDGVTPLFVRFTDTSINFPTSWTWDFGDGLTSTEQNATHTYATAGIYTVNLTVTNAGGSDSEVKTDYITVTSPEAKTWTVGASGCDFTDLDTAFASPSLNDGDIILVSAGSYTLSTPLAKAITLRGAVTVSPTGAAFSGPGTVIDGITFTGGSISISGAGSTVTNCTFTGFTGQHSVAISGQNVTVDRNVFQDNPTRFMLITGNGHVFTNNTFEANGGSQNAVTRFDGCSGVTIAWNTFANNTAPAIGLRCTVEDNRIFLNNFIDNKADLFQFTNNPKPLAMAWNTSSTDYTYQGTQYAGVLGNYYNSYTGEDADGNGVFDAACTLGANQVDNAPLVDRWQEYSSGAATTPSGPSVLPGYSNIFVRVANDAGVKYNAFGNHTYNIRFEGVNRGLNALHVSTDPAVNFGQVTVTDEQTGTFYATDSGGKGYEDEIILLVAVNGTIPDDFALHITSDGYTWTPNPSINQPPSLDDVVYQAVALDETFTKDDFIYGPQIWKPTGNEVDYPLYAGQDLTDTENTFHLMFVDLNAGVLRPNTDLENQGAVRINYTFENMDTFAAFSVYGYCQNPNNGDNMVAWTNALTPDKTMSGYSIVGAPCVPPPVPVAAFAATPLSGDAPLEVQFTDDSNGSPTSWSWDFNNDGIIDSTDRNPSHTYTVAGTYTVNLTVTNAVGSDSEEKTDYIVVSESSEPETHGGVIPAVNDVYLKVANDYGARFNDFGNNTFHIYWTGGGLNAISISGSPQTDAKTGTFYINENGGRGYHDEIFLCIAVNGTISDNFRIHVKADGYQWTPHEMPHTPPAEEDIEYVNPTLDEWFDKEDFIYGPQTWKPAAKTTYPIFPDQDISDTSNSFRLMFVDLNGGILTEHPLRVQYEIEHLYSMAAFSAYGYTKKEGLPTGSGPIDYNITSWVNQVGGGVYITGIPQSPPETVVITPSAAEVPVNGKITLTATAYDDLGEEILGTSFAWESADTGVGTVNDDGVFVPVATGETEVFATAGNVTGSAHITVGPAVPLVLDSVTVAPSYLMIFEDEADTWQFTATGLNQFGDPYPDAVFTWTSSNTAVGTVSDSGLLTAAGTGTTTVTASSGGIEGSAAVTIRERPDWTLDLKGVSDTQVDRPGFMDIAAANPLTYIDNRDNLWEGTDLKVLLGLIDDDDPATFNATKAAAGYIVTVKGSGDESSSAQLDSTVLVSGEEYIVANMLNGKEIPDYEVDGRLYWPLYFHSTGEIGSGNVVEQVTEISISIPVDVATIALTPGKAHVWSDETLQFAAEGFNSTGGKIEDLDVFLWASSNPDVGTVDANGLFTPLTAGETVVSASAAGVSAEANVTVHSADGGSHAWHVEQDGTGDFSAIGDAIAFSRNDDTVIVGDGEWSENIAITHHLNLTTKNGPVGTALTSAANPVIYIKAHNVKVSGFTFAPASSAGYGINMQDSIDCEISGNVFEPGFYYGIQVKNSKAVSVTGNTVNLTNNGIIVDGSTNCKVAANTVRASGTGIRNNYGNGCVFSGNDVQSTGDRGMEFQDGTGHQLLNNRIEGPSLGMIVSMGSGTPFSLVTGNSVTGQFYLNQVTGYFPCYLNDFTGAELKLRNCAPSFGLSAPTTYLYDGTTYTGSLGNYYSTYAGTDSDGDGIGDEPKYVGSTVIDVYPLMQTADHYTITGIVPVVATVVVSPESLSLNLTETGQFSATAYNAEGIELPGTTFTWTCSPGNLGTVNATGYFTALVEGTGTVSATADGISGSSAMTVIRPTPVLTTIAIDPESLTVVNGNTQQFTATGLDAYDLAIDGVVFNWTSSNKAVGTVNATGFFTALSEGTTTITATNGTLSGSAGVMVENPSAPATITISPESVFINEGDGQNFTASAYNAVGELLPDAAITWASSNEGVGTIDATGLFSALSAGDTTVSATAGAAAITASVRVLADPGGPRTLYVDDDGPADFTTIGDAVVVAHPTDTIIVRAGTYTENIVADKKVTIRSENGPEETIITAGDSYSPAFTLTGNESTIKGLTIQGGDMIIAMSGVGGCTIQDNILTSATDGIVMEKTRDNRILNNVFTTFSGTAVRMAGAVSDMVAGNTISSVNGRGISIYDSTLVSDGVIIRDNTLTDCTYGIYLRYDTASGTVVDGNDITGGSYAICIRDDATDNLVTGNTIRQAGSYAFYTRSVSGNTFYLNTVEGNAADVRNSGATSLWNSTESVTYAYNGTTYSGFVGNFWDTYAGSDTDGNGIADEPFAISGSDTDHYPLIQPGDFYAVEGQEPTLSASFTADPTTGKVPCIVSFTDTSTGEGITGYEWDFGDGSTSTRDNPTHIYRSAGEYTVTLTVSSESGTDIATGTIKVTGGSIGPGTGVKAQFTSSPSAGKAPLEVQFTDHSRGAEEWTWDFGDGSKSDEQNPVHVYTTAGTYKVTLSISGIDGSDTATGTVFVTGGSIGPGTGVKAQFTSSPSAGKAPLEVQFTDHSRGAEEWAWDFGDGTASTEQNPVHVYTSSGTYKVTLSINGDNGSDTSTGTVLVTDGSIGPGSQVSASFTVSPIAGKAPLEVQFTDHSRGAEEWAWDFGDGTASTEQNPVHVYTSSGTYKVTLTINGGDGSDTATGTVFVTGGSIGSGSQLSARFTVSPKVGKAPLEVQFTDHSTGAGEWAWDFGDGSGSTEQNPVHVYTSSGTYEVTLTINSRDGSDTATGTVLVIGGSSVTGVNAKAQFTASPIAGRAPLEVQFTDRSSWATNWTWDFGDGMNSTETNPVHVFTDKGTFKVTLTVLINNSTESAIKTIWVL